MKSLFTSFVVVVLGFALASCGSEPEDPDSTSRLSASPTPTLSPPTKPANWDEATPEAAADFVYYWVDVVNFAYATGQLDELKRISGSDCEGCNVAIEMIDEIYGAGGHVKGNSWSTAELELEVEPLGAFVTMRVTAEPGEVVKTAGSDPEPLSSMERTFYAWVERDRGGWEMTKMGSGVTK